MGRRSNTWDDFVAKFEISPTGCWLWQRAQDKDGYALFKCSNKQWRGHIYAYVNLIGPVPDDLVLDHLCEVKQCVNPDHLEPVTNQRNILRSSVTLAAINAAKTHCPAGHGYTPENTRMTPQGRRRCAACNRAKSAKNRVKVPRKTHCLRGHEYTLENTIIKKKDGTRECRTCHRAKVRRYLDRKLST